MNETRRRNLLYVVGDKPVWGWRQWSNYTDSPFLHWTVVPTTSACHRPNQTKFYESWHVNERRGATHPIQK